MSNIRELLSSNFPSRSYRNLAQNVTLFVNLIFWFLLFKKCKPIGRGTKLHLLYELSNRWRTASKTVFGYISVFTKGHVVKTTGVGKTQNQQTYMQAPSSDEILN